MKHLITQLCTLAILGSFLAISACTGLEDGPSISLQSTAKKIINTWNVKEAAINNTDVTSEYEGDFFRFFDNGEFKRLDASRLIDLPPFTQPTTMPVNGNGVWELLDDKTMFEVLYTNVFTDPFNSDVTYNEEVNEIWEITRITTEELWLRKDDLFIKLTVSP